MPKRPPGGQLKNQNARKHGFYSRVLDEAGCEDLAIADGMDGLDDEIAILRVKIKALLHADPDNLRLIMEATNTLARMLRTRYQLEKKQSNGVKDAMTKVLTSLASELGVAVGKKTIGL